MTSAGSTGSGRYLTGDFIGADVIRNEITAQATAAAFFEPAVDTIFEIGGQDSKFISLEDGVVVDFEMNKVCAAGTGSFLEEQAEKLGISIVDEFGRLALASEAPARFGDRCTVFMESDLNAHQQRGTPTGDLVGGLAYSIVQNYLQKVVGAKRVGEKILFQGGVANNPSVTAAFAQVTGRPITVPPHFDVTGAIGAAMLAREACPDGRTRFKGWGVSRVPYALERFTCAGCTNQCEIHAVKVEGATTPLCYGGRCEKYEVEERRHRGKGIPDLFARREELLLDGWDPEPSDGRPSVGLARGLMMFWDQFPWWRAFFRELGARVVLSRPTDRSLVTRSLESLVAETCFPVEVLHGHVRDLFERGPDWVFLPFVVDAAGERDNPTCNYNCPWIEAYPFMVRAALEDERERAKLLVPTLHFRYGTGLVEAQLAEALAEPLGVSRRRVHRAVQAAEEAQRSFRAAVRREGAAALAALPGDGRAMVIVGRPYNTGDRHLNLDLPGKLRELDVTAVPMDFLPLDTAGVLRDYDMMYWPNGQRILAGLRAVAADDRLAAVYLSNFRCGPDSFILHYAREEMRGRPWLHLEVDEHSAGAGLITRLEAYLDSLRAARRARTLHASGGLAAPQAARTAVPHVREVLSRPSRGRALYFPFMSDTAHVLAATARACGMDATVLPMQDARDLELGRRHTSSRECFPMICTVGSFLKKLEQPGVDPGRTSFFMPRHTGPCPVRAVPQAAADHPGAHRLRRCGDRVAEQQDVVRGLLARSALPAAGMEGARGLRPARTHAAGAPADRARPRGSRSGVPGGAGRPGQGRRTRRPGCRRRSRRRGRQLRRDARRCGPSPARGGRRGRDLHARQPVLQRLPCEPPGGAGSADDHGARARVDPGLVPALGAREPLAPRASGHGEGGGAGLRAEPACRADGEALPRSRRRAAHRPCGTHPRGGRPVHPPGLLRRPAARLRRRRGTRDGGHRAAWQTSCPSRVCRERSWRRSPRLSGATTGTSRGSTWRGTARRTWD